VPHGPAAHIRVLVLQELRVRFIIERTDLMQGKQGIERVRIVLLQCEFFELRREVLQLAPADL